MKSLSTLSFGLVVILALQSVFISPIFSQDYDGFGKSSFNEIDTNYVSKIKGPLEFKGFAEELSRKLKGAIVTLYESPDGSHEGLTEVRKMVTKGNGEFEFKLEINKYYVLEVQKGGYTTKRVDFDTDVKMARPQYTKVPTFSFRVDMVKDLDGLAFRGSVASVFYQIKKNEFDYELDYSKEELEEEERLLREQEEKRRLAELAAQKKFEIEAAAKLLLEKENASAQEIIAAAIKVGDGNEKKTKEGFLQVFSDVDTLRKKKADAMYAQLLEERKNAQSTGGSINFQAIFDSAKNYEAEIEKAAEEEQKAKVDVLRTAEEEARRKQEEAMALQQKALEVEMSEKMAAAVKAEEIRKAEEKKEKQDKIYYAIFNSNGDSEAAIQNIIKSYPKGDSYKEEKAKAIYAEYEKARLGGTKLSNINYSDLFKAADDAEQKAIQEEISKDIAKGNERLEAFMKKVEEQKQKEQQQIITKIESGLPEASKDRASQVNVFKDALPKNDPYKAEKAKAMYEEYTTQKQKIGGSSTAKMDYSALFKAADEAELKAKQQAKEELVIEKRKAQEQLEARREAIRQEKSDLAAKAAKAAEEVRKVKLADAKNKKELKLAQAIEKGEGDRDLSVQEIVKALPSTGDKQLDQERAEAVYDAYLLEKKKIKQSGNTGVKVDFGALFQAADNAELARLERQYEQKQAVELEKNAAYTEQRIEKATAIAQAQEKEAVKELERADIAYESTLHKIETERQERIAAQKKREEDLAKQIAMEQAKREALEKGVKEEELARIEKEREARLAKERKEAEDLAAKELAEKRKEEQLAEQEAARQLALAEKAQKQAEIAALKAEQERKREEEKRIAAEEKAKRDAELAAAKAEEDKRKEEEAKLAADAKAKRDAELAAQKAEEQRLKEEEQRLAAEAKAKRDAEIAAQKAEEQRIKDEERRLAEAAKQKAEEDERKRKEEFERLIYLGDQAFAKEEYKTARDNFKGAVDLDGSSRDAANKLASAESELARVEKEQADQLALNQKFDALMSEGNTEFGSGNYEQAKSKYTEASALKPEEKEPKRKIKEVDNALAKMAKEEKEQQALERKYILLMQDGGVALRSSQLEDARSKYEEASSLKPQEQEPKDKLAEIDALEDQLAAAELEKQQREEEAKRKFAEQQKREEEERKLALRQFEQQKEEEMLTVVNKEEERIKKFEQLKESIEKMDLEAEEQRLAFLSELAKIYPEGLTKERVEGKNFVLLRHVVNQNNVVTIYEKKTWDWGGVFYFKDSDIAITQAIYELEIGKYGQ